MVFIFLLLLIVLLYILEVPPLALVTFYIFFWRHTLLIPCTVFFPFLSFLFRLSFCAKIGDNRCLGVFVWSGVKKDTKGFLLYF